MASTQLGCVIVYVIRFYLHPKETSKIKINTYYFAHVYALLRYLQ